MNPSRVTTTTQPSFGKKKPNKKKLQIKALTEALVPTATGVGGKEKYS